MNNQNLFSGAPRAEPHTHRKLTEPCFWFFMVIMASGMVRGRVRRTYVVQHGGHSLMVERVKQDGRIKAAFKI